MNKKISYIFLIFIGLLSCKKDVEVITDNDAPYYGELPTLLLENYVNRLYIDLIGREPLDAEMENDVQFLRDKEVTLESRGELIKKLQFDTTFVEGDSSYKFAYYHRMYDMLKVRLLEGASNNYIGAELGNHYAAYLVDSVNGNMLDANKKLLNYHKLNNVLIAEMQYYNGVIEINEVHRRMVFNSVYDAINMNTFNFINAAFDNLLFRYPTNYEFDEVYKMIEDNTAQIVLGGSANNKGDFTYLICSTKEFYEGTIVWCYGTLLARNPTTEETAVLMDSYFLDKDFQKVQRFIMKTDEYAHFN
ncbi:MAG: hypothetical protein HN535_03095 [Flavobacteriales bacterium]|jgi:hypothetical protein|nr:hypothetical protein [Flavobacteriales bacterium]